MSHVVNTTGNSTDHGAYNPRMAVLSIAGVFMALAVSLSVAHMAHHAFNYRRPDLQRYILRIIFMVIVYAILSFFSIVFLEASTYFDVVREFYEAYAMYTFMSLLECLVGGEAAVRNHLSKQGPMPHLFPFNYCLPPMKPSHPDFHLNLRRGVLQLVLTKLVLGVITSVLEACGVYYDGHLRLDGGYLYCVVIYNFSMSISMYSLIVFYQCFKDPLRTFKPFAKFLCIKLVIFATFWQSCLLSLLLLINVLKPVPPYTKDDIATGIQDLLICIEMFFASLGHFYAYGSGEFQQMDSMKLPFQHALKDTFSGARDVVDDAKLVFNPRARKRAIDYDTVAAAAKEVGFEDDAEMINPDEVLSDHSEGVDISAAVSPSQRRRNRQGQQRRRREASTADSDENTHLLVI